jgi:hypothetical protein
VRKPFRCLVDNQVRRVEVDEVVDMSEPDYLSMCALGKVETA